MVYSGVAEERQRVRSRESMAMGPERSKPLHNFELPYLRWGNQKYLRCMKVESSDGSDGAADRRSPASRFADSSHSSGSRRKDDVGLKRFAAERSKIDGEDGIEAMREKLTLDLKTAASRMKDAILRKGVSEDEAAQPPPEARPWNLRTRRAACKEPVAGVKAEERSPIYEKWRGSPEKKERVKFSVSLSRKEIEDDYAAMLGERPPRRPKKRVRIVQKQLDSLFPGLWLTEVSEDMYKVAELPENGKR